MSLEQIPGAADERTQLLGYIDYLRDEIIRKLEGLDAEQSRFKPAPGANSLLAVVNHVAGVEKRWFQGAIAGEDVKTDRGTEFSPPHDLTADQAISNYRDVIARSNDIARGVDPNAMCKAEHLSGYTVRWVLLHMIEELGRHAGHADITRELVDGTVDDS